MERYAKTENDLLVIHTNNDVQNSTNFQNFDLNVCVWKMDEGYREDKYLEKRAVFTLDLSQILILIQFKFYLLRKSASGCGCG